MAELLTPDLSWIGTAFKVKKYPLYEAGALTGKFLLSEMLLLIHSGNKPCKRWPPTRRLAKRFLSSLAERL